jgi:YegS/Rv2252/BmrU family lipid kinase
MIRAICIYNPASRKAPTQSLINDLRSRFLSYDYLVEFRSTEHPVHATELARNAVGSGADLVIACGGDGTIHEVVAGLALSPMPLAILPSGTANVLARELRLPLNPLKTLNLIPTLQPRRIALGKCGSHYFLLMAGAGIDAATIVLVDSDLKSRFGSFAYWIAGLRCWRAGYFPSFSVCVDRTRFTCTFVVVGRVSRYGGSIRITRNAKLLSDQFDVCLFPGKSRLDYLRYLVGVASGTHHRFRDVVCMSGKNVEITSEEPVRIQLDGELCGFTPAKLEVVPNALTLMVRP